MHAVIKFMAVGSLMVLTACGGKTEAPENTTTDTPAKTDTSADVRASLPADASAFDVHIAAIIQITDDLNAINTMDDAIRLKERIAANFTVMNSSLKEYTAQTIDYTKGEVDAFVSRQDEYETVTINYMKAMENLGKRDPKLNEFIAPEISIMPKR